MPVSRKHFRIRSTFLMALALAVSIPSLLSASMIMEPDGNALPQAAGDEPAGATDSREKWRMGVLFWHNSPNDEAALKGIREALEETGHGHELIVKQADSDPDKAAVILDGFKAKGVDLIFSMGTQASLLAAKRIKEIPIVFTAVTNPVESGVVKQWEGSGTNLAGNSNWIASETVLHVFQLAVPNLERLGILRSRTAGVVSGAELRGMKDHLAKPEAPKIRIIDEVVEGKAGIGPAVKRLLKAEVQAIWIPIDFDIYKNIDEVQRHLGSQPLPLVSSSLKATKAGAVAGVVVDYTMLGKGAVVIALDILEHSRPPGEIPIGTMNGYQVIVNLDAAKRCHYELPLSLMVLADSILEKGDPQEEKNDR